MTMKDKHSDGYTMWPFYLIDGNFNAYPIRIMAPNKTDCHLHNTVYSVYDEAENEHVILWMLDSTAHAEFMKLRNQVAVEESKKFLDLHSYA